MDNATQAAGHAPASQSVPPADASRTTDGQTQQIDMLDTTEQVKVEDLPLDKKLEVLKKHHYFENYLVGKFIDAQDTVNTWCLGQIVESENRMIRIHYDGWSSKWDMVCFPSILLLLIFTLPSLLER